MKRSNEKEENKNSGEEEERREMMGLKCVEINLILICKIPTLVFVGLDSPQTVFELQGGQGWRNRGAMPPPQKSEWVGQGMFKPPPPPPKF